MSYKVFGNLLIIDGSYMLHRNMKIKTISELSSSKGDLTGGVFGFLRSLGKAISNSPKGFYPIICWDSRVSQRRLDLYPNYKRHEDKEKDKLYNNIAELLIDKPESVDLTPFSDEEYENIKIKVDEIISIRNGFAKKDDYIDKYIDQRDKVINICNYIGIPSIKYKNWEGDDLITLLTRMSNRSIVVTDDSDMLQLISDNVSVMRVLRSVRIIDNEVLMIEHGYESARLITLVKSIVGDASDNIPHLVNGVGEVAARELAEIIIGCGEVPSNYLPRIASFKNKKYDKFIEAHDQYLINLQLVDLSLVPDDEEVINHIIGVVKNLSSSYLEALNTVNSMEMKVIDLDSIFNYVSVSRQNLFV